MKERSGCSGRGRLFERGAQVLEDGGGDAAVAFGSGVEGVVLHQFGVGGDAIEEEGDQEGFLLAGEVFEDVLEIADVVGAVVAGEGHAAEKDAGAGGLAAVDHFGEVGAGGFGREAAEAVVGAEGEDDDGGFEEEGFIEAGDTAAGGVAADAEVDDAEGEVFLIEAFLEPVGVAEAGLDAIAGGEAVAEGGDDGAGVWGLGGRYTGGRGGGGVGFGGLLGGGSTAGEGGEGGQPEDQDSDLHLLPS